MFETTALTLRHIKSHPEAFVGVENYLSGAMNYIMEKNLTDMIGYAFQLYALFVANSTTLQDNYRMLTESLLGNKANWDKDMKYLVPAMAGFLVAMIYKYPDYVAQFTKNLTEIINHLMLPEIRMETIAMQIGSALFEKLGIVNEVFLN